MIALLLAALASCAPAAELDGDPVLVARLLPPLLARGLASPRPGCPVVKVTVTQHDGGLRIESRDALGREQVRELQDPSAAPAVIEGLLRSGVTVTIEPPRAPSRSTESVPAFLETGAEGAIDDQGSFSSGARLGLARAVGPVTALLRLRWSFTPSVSTSLPAAQRHDVEVGVAARRSFPVAGLAVSPGLALAVAATWSARVDPGCGRVCGRPAIRDGASATAVAPRGAAFVELSRSLGTGLEGSALLELVLSPLAAGPRVPGWARSLPASEAARVALPGDPSATIRAGLGLVWGRR